TKIVVIAVPPHPFCDENARPSASGIRTGDHVDPAVVPAPDRGWGSRPRTSRSDPLFGGSPGCKHRRHGSGETRGTCRARAAGGLAAGRPRRGALRRRGGPRDVEPHAPP